MKSFTSLRGLTRSTLMDLIESSIRFSERLGRHEQVEQELSGRAVANLFFEPSTRTRLSFELAARRLGAEVLTFDPPTSSVVKGESVRDTAQTMAAIGADILVVRHSMEGTPERVHEWTGLPVINGGDGCHEHPTQGLLDAVTLVRHFGDVEGLRMGIVGDIRHSRVAGSLAHIMPTLGVSLTLVGPGSLLPEEDPLGVGRSESLDAVLGDLDVVYLLRVQQERGVEVPHDYVSQFGMSGERAAAMDPGAVIMHPGPINRGVEVSDEVADGPRSLILAQVANGVSTRMAVLVALRDGMA